jgi:hypothetical protein
MLVAIKGVHPMIRKSLHAVVISFLLFFVPVVKTQDKSPRAYFDELKSAGAFVHTLTDDKGEKLSAPARGYVCFAENNSLADSTGLFLIFETMAYDKNYNEAEAIFMNLNASLEERKKALVRMEDIQNRQPYVAFLPDELMSAMPVEGANFFRKGGQELDLSVYWHGVKNQRVSYHRFNETDEWKTENGKAEFAIESSTMRFLWSVHGDKPLMFNGSCEKIYRDKT